MLARTSLVALLLSASARASRSGLEQMEHLVIFMQENRAYDHYYGSLQGVRGFNNRATHPLASGLPAMYQPSGSSEGYTLPVRFVGGRVCVCQNQARRAAFPE